MKRNLKWIILGMITLMVMIPKHTFAKQISGVYLNNNELYWEKLEDYGKYFIMITTEDNEVEYKVNSYVVNSINDDNVLGRIRNGCNDEQLALNHCGENNVGTYHYTIYAYDEENYMEAPNNGRVPNTEKSINLVLTKEEEEEILDIEGVPSYLVTFDTDGGDEIPSQRISENGKINIPMNPVKADADFINWFRDVNLNEPYDLTTPVVENVNLIAKYQIIEEDLSLVSNVSKIDFGKSKTYFENHITKNVILKNTSAVSLFIDIKNPTTSGPFGSIAFPTNYELKPNEEKEITLAAIKNSAFVGLEGDYTGTYKITGTSAKGNTIELEIEGKISLRESSIGYTTHVQRIGWQDYVSDGDMAGTSGQALRLEGIKIKLNYSHYEGNVLYRTHIQSYGWEKEFKKNDEMSGTSGEAKRLEAIEIKLDGELADYYDIYYRVHAQTFGWLGWARNGEQAGTAGFAKRLEGIEIKLVKKGTIFEEYGELYSFVDSEKGTITPIGDNKKIAYTTHVQRIGWQDYVTDGQMAGTSGQALRLEAIKIKLANQDYEGDILYRTHVQTFGWEEEFKKNDEVSGTSGLAKRLEAIEIKLNSVMSVHYDVYYRVHAQSFGWLGWAKNGEPAGTAGFAKRLEGIEIILVPKGELPPIRENQNREEAFIENE